MTLLGRNHTRRNPLRINGQQLGLTLKIDMKTHSQGDRSRINAK
jgi:hypothetical protein